MTQKFRIYRYSKDDPFMSPRGWFKGHGTVWVVSSEITPNDFFDEEDAQTLCDDWNSYFAAKGLNFIATMEAVT